MSMEGWKRKIVYPSGSKGLKTTELYQTERLHRCVKPQMDTRSNTTFCYKTMWIWGVQKVVLFHMESFYYPFLQLSSKRFVPDISASTKSIIRFTFAEWMAETSFSHNGWICFSMPARYFCKASRRFCKRSRCS